MIRIINVYLTHIEDGFNSALNIQLLTKNEKCPLLIEEAEQMILVAGINLQWFTLEKKKTLEGNLAVVDIKQTNTQTNK